MHIKENKCIEDIAKSRVRVSNTLEILSTNSREPRERLYWLLKLTLITGESDKSGKLY